MAKLTRDEFISSLKEMSILEIKELVDAMKEEFGVDPSAVAVAGPVAAAVEEGPSKVNVVLTAAGMLSKGRSRLWLKRIIEDSRNTVLFVGYASENTLAAAIKNSKGSRGKIKIDDREYRNRCKIVDLKSFTSHMQYDDLLNYYSSISADKICLVHSEQLGKLEFAKVLQETIEKRGSRARVVCVNRYTSIKL